VPYLPNLATSDEKLFRKSLQILNEEIMLSERLNSDYLVIHPGGYSLGSSAEFGLNRIINALNAVLDEHETNIMILLENVSGGGRRLGSAFEN